MNISKEATEAVGELMRETNIFPNQVEIAKKIVQSAIEKAMGRRSLHSEQQEWDKNSAICYNCGVIQHYQLDAICVTCQQRALEAIPKKLRDAHNASVDAALAQFKEEK